MTLPLYLAMTDWETTEAADFSGKFAYMACHFAPYSYSILPAYGKINLFSFIFQAFINLDAPKFAKEGK